MSNQANETLEIDVGLEKDAEKCTCKAKLWLLSKLPCSMVSRLDLYTLNISAD